MENNENEEKIRITKVDEKKNYNKQNKSKQIFIDTKVMDANKAINIDKWISIKYTQNKHTDFNKVKKLTV